MLSERKSSLVPEPELAKLTVAAVARRLGVAPSTLRTWDRRYGLGPSDHCLGEHRKYSEADLARLFYMHNLVISGVSPADAARLAATHTKDSVPGEVAPIPRIDGERGPRRANREATAKAVCATCPVIAACRKHALAVQEPYGIWGGLSEDDRVAIIEQGERAIRPVAVLTPAS